MNQDITLEQILSVVGDLEVHRRRLEVENSQLKNELSQLKGQNNGQNTVTPDLSEVLPKE